MVNVSQDVGNLELIVVSKSFGDSIVWLMDLLLSSFTKLLLLLI